MSMMLTVGFSYRTFIMLINDLSEPILWGLLPWMGVVLCQVFFLFFLNFLIFIYFWERDRAQVEEGHRERETQNPKKYPGSEHRAQHGAQTHELWRSWPEPESNAQLSHPGAPSQVFFLNLLRWSYDFHPSSYWCDVSCLWICEYWTILATQE